MAASFRFSAGKLLLGMGLAAALVVGTTACTEENSAAGTVVSVTDGDTLVATVNGENQSIRLLNIDAPETKDPNKPVECLGPEADTFLKELLPAGAKITLLYDVERTDKYDRTLAAVFTADDTFVSAEIARAGLGTAVSFGKNSKFLPPVQEAEEEAKAEARGIHGQDVDCTLPAQIAAATAALENATAAASGAGGAAGAGGTLGTAAAAGVAVAAAAAAVSAAKTLLTALKAGKSSTDLVRWSAFDAAELALQVSRLSTNIEDGESSLAKLQKAETALTRAEADAAAAKTAAAEAKAKEIAAAAQAAAEAQAQAEAQAAAQAAADAAAAEAERIRNLPPVYVPPAPAPYEPPAPAPYEPPVQGSGGDYPGYTGPRCYLPGGKTYRPC